MGKLLIVYHSQGGNTEAMAKAAYEGAVSSGAEVSLKKAVETTSDDILDCDGIIIGTPDYFSYMAGMIKDLFDRVWYIIREKVENKPYALFCNAGGGSKKSLERLEGLCHYLKLVKAFDDVVGRGQPTTEVLEECRKMGGKLAGLQASRQREVENE